MFIRIFRFFRETKLVKHLICPSETFQRKNRLTFLRCNSWGSRTAGKSAKRPLAAVKLLREELFQFIKHFQQVSCCRLRNHHLQLVPAEDSMHEYTCRPRKIYTFSTVNLLSISCDSPSGWYKSIPSGGTIQSPLVSQINIQIANATHQNGGSHVI